MPKYQTRMLTADVDISLGPNYHAKGERFAASEVDAEYLVGKKKARYAEEESQAAPMFIAPPVDEPDADDADADGSAPPKDALAGVTSTASMQSNPVRRPYVRRNPPGNSQS